MTDAQQTGHETHTGVEDEAIDTGQLFRIVAGATIVVIVLIAVAISVTNLRFQKARTDAAQETGYPQLQETRMEGFAKLDRYEVVDREANIYRIPIERAMQRIVEESQ